MESTGPQDMPFIPYVLSVTKESTAGLRSIVLTVISALSLSLLTASSAKAQQIVAPNNLTTTEGGTSNGYPILNVGGMRYQQVYNASQFSSLSAPSLITQIAFRPDAINASAFTRTLSNVVIRLSTTSAAADGLSTTFANNLGTNTTTVYSGALSLSTAFTGPVGGPKNFDVIINLTTPFLYNPAAGNLLMDWLNSSPENTALPVFFDAVFVTGDSVSRTYSAEGSPNAASGGADSVGVVTRFTFVPNITTAAPEPGSLNLLIPVLGTMGIVLRRRRK